VRVKFNLLDKIEQLTDERIVAVKYVSLAEEYLADHFPTFPVLPGVMMLEAVVQAAGWLLHHRTNFAKSMAVLKEARNVLSGRGQLELIREFLPVYFDPSRKASVFGPGGKLASQAAIERAVAPRALKFSSRRCRTKAIASAASMR